MKLIIIKNWIHMAFITNNIHHFWFNILKSIKEKKEQSGNIYSNQFVIQCDIVYEKCVS